MPRYLGAVQLLPAGAVTLVSNVGSPGRTDEKNSETVASPLPIDAGSLTAMELRHRFPGEAIAHRNMLQRSKDRGVAVHPDFRKFRSFLASVGPMPTVGATLDRVNNSDLEYVLFGSIANGDCHGNQVVERRRIANASWDRPLTVPVYLRADRQ